MIYVCFDTICCKLLFIYFYSCLQVRSIISDFSVILAIGLMVGVDAFVGLATPKLEVPTKFQVRKSLSFIAYANLEMSAIGKDSEHNLMKSNASMARFFFKFVY